MLECRFNKTTHHVIIISELCRDVLSDVSDALDLIADYNRLYKGCGPCARF